MIQAGKLREKINLASPTNVKNSSGGHAPTPASYLDSYAEVVEMKSDPELIASQENVAQLVKFRIRYRTDVVIKNGDYLTWRGQVFIVNNIKVDPLRTSIEMIVKSVMDTTERST